MKIVIYGLGNDGKAFLSFLKQLDGLDVEIMAITDTNEERYDSLTGGEKEKFKNVNEALLIDYDYVIVASSKYYDEISNDLLNRGVGIDKILSVEAFKEILPKKYYCNFCNNRILFWNHAGNDGTLFENRIIIGAGKRLGQCPKCGSIDRTRFVYEILKNKSELFSSGGKVLHFAPEEQLERKIRGISGIQYISADIESGRADVQEDITNLSFENETFDYIICNHVLEHIADERAAFQELERCLKKHGKIIITVPIDWEKDTFEDKSIVSKEDRIQYYGQEDHVRQYGRDVVRRFEQYGLNIKTYRSDEMFSEAQIKYYGYIKGDMVIIAERKEML